MNVHSLSRTTPTSRALLVQRVVQERWTIAETAEAAGISERTVYKWLARYRAHGARGLVDRPCRPRRSPGRLARERVELIVQLRRCRKSGPQIARELGMARSTVARVLFRAGLQRLKNLDPKEPPRRYERRHPGELLHMDVKKLGRIGGRVGHRIHGDRSTRCRGVGWEFVHVCVDDASRLAYVEVLTDERGVTASGFLSRAVAWYRRLGITPERVMTDNGSPYVSTVFRATCQGFRLTHLRTRPYRPRTNGKAERFIGTLVREWAYVRPYKSSKLRTGALKAWLWRYNRQRPHGSLDGRPPISRILEKPEQRA